MTRQFSKIAEKLSAVAAHVLGWSPDQFWQATPQELATIFSAAEDVHGKIAAPLDDIELQKLKEEYPDG